MCMDSLYSLEILVNMLHKILCKTNNIFLSHHASCGHLILFHPFVLNLCLFSDLLTRSSIVLSFLHQKNRNHLPTFLLNTYRNVLT